MVGDWGGGGGLTFDSENTKYLFKPRLNKLRNISRQVNFKYIILSCNLQFFSLQEFWCLAKKKRSNGGGYGPPNLPPWSANGNPEGIENNSCGGGHLNVGIIHVHHG